MTNDLLGLLKNNQNDIMLKVEIEINDNKYKGLEDLFSSYSLFTKHLGWIQTYCLKIEESSFYSLVFALYQHVNNKDNWLQDPDKEDIKLIFNFENDCVSIEVYDHYLE